VQGVRQSYTVLRNVRLNIGAKHTSTSVKDVEYHREACKCKCEGVSVLP